MVSAVIQLMFICFNIIFHMNHGECYRSLWIMKNNSQAILGTIKVGLNIYFNSEIGLDKAKMLHEPYPV